MNKKILLIEDDGDIASIYKRQLDLAGLETTLCSTGKAGLEEANKNTYNLILLDIMLPDINGLDVLRQLNQNETTKTTPVVFLTNLGQESIIKEGFGLGVKGYLLKPVLTPDQVVEEVKFIMEQKEPQFR